MLKYVFSVLLIAAVWGAVLWFEQPWWIAIVATAVIVAVVSTIVLLRWLRARKAARELERALRAQAAAQAVGARPDLKGEIDALQAEFNHAIAALKSSRAGRSGAQALYALPWYVIIGPPGAGKSTALRNSGLRFPYLSARGRGGAIQGLGGTRNCEWWMTNEAVILDTAGRYTTEESDRDEWLGFLDLLKRNRSRQPINGLIVALSVAEFEHGTHEAIQTRAKEIRARIDEITARLEVLVPVYVLFTKCDLLPGFVEMFGDLGGDERNQIWGFTLPIARRVDPHTAFMQHFDELGSSIERRAIRRMSDERRIEARERIYALPQHFVPLRDRLAGFVAELFAESIYHQTPMFRGAYFTSGTQEGRPIDRIMSSVAEAFGLAQSLPVAAPVIAAKSYFLGDLFTRVIFPDRRVAMPSARRLRRQRILFHGLGAALCLLSIGAILAPAAAFKENRGLLKQATLAVLEVQRYFAADTIDPITVEQLEPLRTTTSRLVTYEVDGVPASLGFGMYVGDTLWPALADLYIATVGTQLVDPQLDRDAVEMKRMSAQYLHNSGHPSDDEFGHQVDLLHAHLLLTGPKEAEEPGLDETQRKWLAQYLAAAWQSTLTVAGQKVSADQALALATTYVDLLIRRPPAKVRERDVTLVEGLRKVLQRTDRTAALLAQLVQELNQGIAALGLRDMIAAPAIQNGNRAIAGAFTKPGYEKIEALLARPIEQGGDEWVLGRTTEGAAALHDEELAAMRSRYFELYIQEWQQFIGSLYVKAPGDYVEALTMMQDLTRGAAPPFAALLQHVAYHTRLVDPNAKKDDLVDAAQEGIGKKISKKLGKKAAIAGKVVDAVRGPDEISTLLQPPDVEAAFVGLVRFGVPAAQKPVAEGAPPPPPEAVPLDVYQEQLVFIRDALQARIEDPNEAEALVGRVKTARSQIKGLLAEQDIRWRPRLETMLWPPIEAVWDLAGKSVAQDLERSWCNDVALPFERTLASRYPFKPDGYDVTIADFTKFFQPEQGAVWQYYQAALAGKIPREGDRFIVAEQGEASRTQFASGLLPFLDQVHDIGTVMFPGGSGPLAEFDVLIQGTPNISETTFTVDGVDIKYRNGPETWQRMRWPGDGDKRGAALRAKGYGINGHVEQEGEWGFFRLLEQGTVLGSAEQRVFTVKWDLSSQGAGLVTLKIRPTRRETPFFGVPGNSGKVMSTFRSKRLAVPKSIVQGGYSCDSG